MMQLPIKAHYATVAMLALAQQYNGGQPVTVRAIADEHDIPPQFLVQIMQQLRAAGMITSSRGSAGGFRLDRSPTQITIADIVEAVCPASSTSPAEADSPLNGVMRNVWNELDEIVQQHLSRLSLSQLCEQAEQDSQAMFYI